MDWLCWVAVLASPLVFFAIFCVFILLRARYSRTLKEIPGKELRNPIFGNILEYPTLNCFQRWKHHVSLYGRVYRFYTYFGQLWVVTVDPDAIRWILATNAKNYVRGPLTGVDVFRKIVGTTSMLVTDGDLHRKHRTLASPAFRISNLRRLVSCMEDGTQRLIQHWTQHLKGSDLGEISVEIRREMSRVTLTVIGSAGFGFDFNCIGNDESPLVQSLEQVIGIGRQAKMWQFLPYMSYIPVKRTRALWSGLRELQKIFENMVKEKKKAENQVENTLLHMILNSDDKAGTEALSDKELRDEMMTFILAGHETSSLTLTYAIRLLCRAPEIQQKCREEIDRVFADDALNWDSVESLSFTKAVVFETLRLFPPVPLLPRTAIQEDILCGFRIPAKTAIGVLVGHMHRLPEFWSEPDTFKPERFLADQVPWEAWMPFGDGQHKCLGYKFALMEIVAVLALLLRRFEFRMTPAACRLRLNTVVTMQPADPVIVQIRLV